MNFTYGNIHLQLRNIDYNMILVYKMPKVNMTNIVSYIFYLDLNIFILNHAI